MHLLNDIWLRGQAAQQSTLQLTAYGTAFAGTTALQAMSLGLRAPQAFWSAMGRASGAKAPDADA
ncbi:hypothetical protein [Hasllibacter sp. MH4015]|uniref:hypothetical protein n=1 Tax=Hasllibacter sp. MH4015 TaxID=2854029 RepID=UPI001CD25390|nr:hypothetical protein [Hasllibacter sp. MH4015]